ncbi:cytochrome b561 and DOMON domain-containing protein At3g25290-like [Prosopis cineraria]|uniref:cytochrome b561 and DOMON domain-containing protein At3g25290-like n=1 Tax=Prosopis cineraria TaxID=364024 RepID=UPI00240ECBE4|nr:cytochrome b561 and DOMON domain-containing protein At3g25290-like [Prosopis cineraria]
MASLPFSLSFLLTLLLCSTVTMMLFSPAASLTCTSQKLTSNEIYSNCIDLPLLSSYLHWTFNSTNSSLSIAFVAAPADSDGWVSWAINPTGVGMVGAQALIAFKNNGVMTVKTYKISSYQSVVPGKLSFEVWDTKAEESGGHMTIFAKIKVPGKKDSLNQVWQVGPSVTNGVPDRHDLATANMKSKGTLSLTRVQSSTGGESSTSGGVDSTTKKRNIHGVLNAVSWGILFPLGAIIARYLRTFPSADPAWFYLHAFCQVSAYAIGVAGWATGLKLGSESQGIQYSGHRNIGIAAFCLATIQIFALFVRPQKDHKYRYYWNIYHHSIGYSVIILGIINIFRGFDILRPEQKWKTTYVIVIAALGGIALFLEVITWIIVLRRKSNKSTKPYDAYNNGQNRQQPFAA